MKNIFQRIAATRQSKVLASKGYSESEIEKDMIRLYKLEKGDAKDVASLYKQRTK